MADIEPTNPTTYVGELARRAKRAAARLATATTEEKNRAIREGADALVERRDAILRANARDVDNARNAGKNEAFIDRLALDADRIDAMAEGMRTVADLDDPVGRVLARFDRPNGLRIERVAVPIGVIGMIYESRPNVGADASALCLKSGNAVILRGGSDSQHSAREINAAIAQGLAAAGLPREAVQVVGTTDRAAVGAMLEAVGKIDLIIPRGGKSLVERVRDQAKVPTLLHLDGNCHSYVHAAADLEKAVRVVQNAKQRRLGVCGATESLVVDRDIATEFLPKLREALGDCELRGDEEAQRILPGIAPASEADWDTEYLDNILSVKVVGDLDEAIDFVSAHHSGHTDAILTEDDQAATAFLTRVDSAVVMHNASTQFSDGGEFGMGAEIGIATGKMHARGPVGLEQLCSFHYRVHGDGQTRPA
ncbi:glutamate-5-semialdehyde dehydrogenase [Sphingomicrobium astaxanthinifaciens]|uniref:glutamate-5-semialdehyde dehydrogenase n=1 Tax=Sphingomicrobium astaxanthinifaciens TaxID=1227949 RepID=UPI001FCB6BF0|nr:glutamate-5-semialdehyde dehydrogenase [Sphingomicrobium astaxanthinifaciens]MCJ7420247.1 glutamate-5-semialdehyde dehydrogenase [Sphingomicrobium astaxanthinifaciens]